MASVSLNEDGLRNRKATAATASADASPVQNRQKPAEEVVWGKTPSGQGACLTPPIISWSRI